MKRIWNSFSEVDREYGYANEYINRAKETAISYLKAYLLAIHSIGVMLGDKPVLLSLVEDDVVYYAAIGKSTPACELSSEQLYDLCKQLKQQHLVLEYGEPDPEEEQTEQS